MEISLEIVMVEYYIKNTPNAEYFWKINNLPKGTTEFVCVDGKAYLPGQEPKK
ncbi:hypothetical protein EC844_13010 [Acinetobacter calcoaceticus]|uniref:Uncharacterized protein n=1 Tax=Acinetobacter calcoaceticus TaxID=471 RepID=A0A4R1XG37_ACICA|nr:hypothetical protein EC844_13010 [Acinetobacter calcoaceticus]